MPKIPASIFSTGLTDNVFNTNRDLLTGAILDRFTDLLKSDGGIMIESIADTGLQVIATDPYDGTIRVKSGTAYDKFGQRIASATDDTGVAIYTGTVDLSSGVDLSTNKNVKLNIDSAGAVQIDCSTNASNTSSVTIDEIIANINNAGFGTIAFRSDSAGNPITTGKYITIISTISGSSSKVEFTAPSANDASNEIFGLNESSYPHTYSGGGGYTIPADSTTYNVIIEYLSVESVVGNFKGGYPTSGDSKYTKQNDSYKVTITTSAPVNTTTAHELLLATVSNNGSTLTIVDKRGDSIMYLRGIKNISTSAPATPVKVSLTTDNINDKQGYILPKWKSVTSAHGIKAYLIKTSLKKIGKIAVTPNQVHEHTFYGYDPTASDLEFRIELPLGNTYNVQVAAIDNSIQQNISSWLDLGDIVVGKPDTALTMTNINQTPVNNGLRVDWPEVDDALKYEYVYTIDGSTPSFERNVKSTDSAEVEIQAEPGNNVKVRVRAVDKSLEVTDDISGEAIAGGLIIGDNKKLLTLQNVSVITTNDGKTARKLGLLRLANPSTIVELAVNISGLVLNSAAKGVVRVWRDNAEAEASVITFDEDGTAELVIDMYATAGWLVIDAYDSSISGTTQAAFTADVHVTYVEGKVKTVATKGKMTKNTEL